MNPLKPSAMLNRRIRQDNATQLGEPTRPFLEAAVREGRVDDAEAWMAYYLEEASTIHAIFGIWDWYLVRYYLERKGSDAWESLVRASIAPWIGTTVAAHNEGAAVETDGLNATLRVPGLARSFRLVDSGDRYKLVVDAPQSSGEDWDNAAHAAIQAGDVAALSPLLDRRIGEIRMIHDVLCDWAWALLTVIAHEWGEAILDEVMRVTQAPWVTPRYARLQEMTIDQMLQLTIEGMRGHFSGPERAGTIAVDEEPDRFVLSFDACGSGGRMRRGDPTVGSGSRLDAPYHFLNVSGAYDWTWNRKDVCGYCAHCAVVNQILPIEGFGHPMRMTLYPERPEDPCQWVIYKDAFAYPDEAYTAVGKQRPESLP
jgi:hypothetical protein